MERAIRIFYDRGPNLRHILIWTAEKVVRMDTEMEILDFIKPEYLTYEHLEAQVKRNNMRESYTEILPDDRRFSQVLERYRDVLQKVTIKLP